MPPPPANAAPRQKPCKTHRKPGDSQRPSSIPAAFRCSEVPFGARKLTMKDQSFALAFLSGATSQLEDAVAHLGDCRRQASELPESESSEEPRFTRTFSSWSDEVFSSEEKAHRRMATAGGGACKFAPLFRDALRVTQQRFKRYCR